MNYNELAEYLKSKGFTTSLGKYQNIPCVDVNFIIKSQAIELVHFQIDEFSRLPAFHLKNPHSYGQLAHVLVDSSSNLGLICINDHDSVSVNYEQPHIALHESLVRHVAILKKAISDHNWNENELLREFYSNWFAVCNTTEPELICASASGKIEEMNVLRPARGAKFGFESHFLGISSSASELAEYSYISQAQKNDKRTICGIGFIIPLSNVSPVPSTCADVGQWYLNAINAMTENDAKIFKEKLTKRRAKDIWIVFNAETPSGRTWFGIHFKNDKKKTLPLTNSSLEQWKVVPIVVRIFNRERVLPRSGASISLSDKEVLLVGCGSVGGEIAYKLGAAGIGKLLLSDPDVFSLDNTYRHVLTMSYCGYPKSIALSIELKRRYPWIVAKGITDKLLKLRHDKDLDKFDLIIIAIGSPTHERLFHDYLIGSGVSTPVINVWVEGYGIGGHTTLDIPSSKGCFKCAYVDNDSLCRGLASNMNFFVSNQDLTVNHAGCGDLFLPYNSVSAAQTALISSNLAIQYLEGKVTESSKVSWKGDATYANGQGFSLTHRYELFDDSLQLQPLYNENCDICNE